MDTAGGVTTVTYLYLLIVLSSHTKSVSVMLRGPYGFPSLSEKTRTSHLLEM